MDKITGDSVGIANYALLLSKERKNPLESRLFLPWESHPRILAVFRSHSVWAVQVVLFTVSTAAVEQGRETASQENADRELTWDFVVGEDRDEQFGYLEIFQIINESYHVGSPV